MRDNNPRPSPLNRLKVALSWQPALLAGELLLNNRMWAEGQTLGERY